MNVCSLVFRLRQVDVQFMKRMHDKVNIVPIIAKADTLTPMEIHRLKAKVRRTSNINYASDIMYTS